MNETWVFAGVDRTIKKNRFLRKGLKWRIFCDCEGNKIIIIFLCSDFNLLYCCVSFSFGNQLSELYCIRCFLIGPKSLKVLEGLGPFFRTCHYGGFFNGYAIFKFFVLHWVYVYSIIFFLVYFFGKSAHFFLYWALFWGLVGTGWTLAKF